MNAKQAKEISNRNRTINIPSIESAIKESAKGGKYHVFYNGEMSLAERKILVERGFKISRPMPGTNSTMFRISW